MNMMNNMMSMNMMKSMMIIDLLKDIIGIIIEIVICTIEMVMVYLMNINIHHIMKDMMMKIIIMKDHQVKVMNKYLIEN